ncbi:hypothetical protein OQA88_6521 [Cercophora sp. LCS_1]
MEQPSTETRSHHPTRLRKYLTWPWAQATPDLEHDAEEQEGSSPAPDRHSHPFYVYNDNFEGDELYPKGWPYLARSQDVLGNGSLHRRFGTLRKRRLLYLQGRIHYLGTELFDLDIKDAVSDPGALQSLSPWQLGKGRDGAEAMSKKDVLQHELNKLLAEYEQALLNDIALRKLDIVDRPEVNSLAENIKEAKLLNEQARAPYTDIDDFITTRNRDGLMHHPIEWLVYTQGPIHDFLMKLFKDKDTPKGSTFKNHYRGDRLKILFTMVLVSGTLLPLMAPVGILYLVDPSKNWSVAVVVIFGFLATWMMAGVPGIKLDNIILGVSAYMAVLVTFLANFQGSNVQSLR